MKLTLKEYKSGRFRYLFDSKPISPMFKTKEEATDYKHYCYKRYRTVFGPDLRLVPRPERSKILKYLRQKNKK